MEYNFDEIIDRSNSDAVKIEVLKSQWGRDDLLPLWVADMDFRTPACVTDSILKRCERGILGYTVTPDSYYDAIRNWVSKRHNWKIKKEDICYSPGVVPGIAFALHAFTNPGDKVLVQPPVYYPFFLVTRRNNRQLVYDPLVLKAGQYRMNTEHFRKAIKGCKLFILCNPHNPGGRVWSKKELAEIADICYENGTVVVSDEIHADLALPGFKHTPFAKVSKKARNNCVVLMSPSKAFNMPGLSSAYAIIENSKLRKKFSSVIDANELGGGHIFAFRSTEAAYTEGEKWLSEALAYISGNIAFLDEFIKKYMPLIHAVRPEASYLVFLDCRELRLNQKELVHFFVDKAHLALNDGSVFGSEGKGFMRINVGCPRSILEKALHQLKTAYDGLNDTISVSK